MTATSSGILISALYGSLMASLGALDHALNFLKELEAVHPPNPQAGEGLPSEMLASAAASIKDLALIIGQCIDEAKTVAGSKAQQT